AAVGRITSRRRLQDQGAGPPVVRHFLLSKYISPKRLLHITRSHWAIENQLHWVLDVHFAEDRNRARKDNAPENLAILRRLALNILRAHPNPASTAQNQTRRLGRCIPHGNAQPYAIALHGPGRLAADLKDLGVAVVGHRGPSSPQPTSQVHAGLSHMAERF